MVLALWCQHRAGRGSVIARIACEWEQEGRRRGQALSPRRRSISRCATMKDMSRCVCAALARGCCGRILLAGRTPELKLLRCPLKETAQHLRRALWRKAIGKGRA